MVGTRVKRDDDPDCAKRLQSRCSACGRALPNVRWRGQWHRVHPWAQRGPAV